MKQKFATLNDVFNKMKEEFASTLIEQNEIIWRIADVSKETTWSEKTIRNMVSLKTIPCHRIGGKVFFLKGEIIRWIKKNGEKAKVILVNESRARRKYLKGKKGITLYLDININGYRKWEPIGLVLTGNKKIDKELLMQAERIRAKRLIELLEGKYGLD